MSAPVELPFTPYKHQRSAHALRLTVRFLVLVWHRRGGKTVFAVLELILAALACTKERARYGYVAPLLKQSKAVAWDYLKHFTYAIPGCTYNETELWVELPNANRIRLFGADNPDSLRGIYLDGVVMDEVAQMKPSVWGEIIRPALADRQGWAVFIGTPKGVNLFSELYFNALKGLEGWAADIKRADDTEVIPPEELAQAKQSMSPQQYAQEFSCDFYAAVENVLVPLERVQAAMRRDVKADAFTWAAKVLGVDVARFGDDKSAICKRQGQVAYRIETLRGLDTMALADRVAHVAREWKPDTIFVDETGVGAGVVDRLRQLGLRVVGVTFGAKADSPIYKNKRSEMWSEMASWLQSGCLPEDTELSQELTAPTYFFDSSGRLCLESKDDMRERGLASPDRADALACTFAFPVAAPDIRGAPYAHHALTEYNPYAAP